MNASRATRGRRRWAATGGRKRIEACNEAVLAALGPDSDATIEEVRRTLAAQGLSLRLRHDPALLRPARHHAQKKTAHASRAKPSRRPEQREAWFEGQLDLDPERLVFIDETWASTNMARRHGRCRAVNACGSAFRTAIGKRRPSSARSTLRGFIAPFVLDGADRPPRFRDLCREGPRPRTAPGRRRDHGQPARPQGAERAPDDRGRGRKPPLPPALQSRLQSHRERLRQAQGAPAKGRRADRRRPLERHRPTHRSLHTARNAQTSSPPQATMQTDRILL